jgi:hypothetical protein
MIKNWTWQGWLRPRHSVRNVTITSTQHANHKGETFP